MSLELLYTSATAGIRPGTRGFCTVLHTSGTPSNVISRLEGLSGYRHVFSPQSESDDRNPVGFSHLRFSVGGQPVSVVSRVAAYGVDYSGRTNKLAHHVVLEPHELPAAGPAWLLSQPAVMRTEWNGETATPISGPAIPSGDTPAEVCRRWESLTGDAGWGGVVAEALSNVRAKPLWIIHTLDQHPQMPVLIAESVAILPRQQRWLATFSTYYTNLPPEIDCRVRCVLADTEEARVAKTQGNFIDLTTTLQAAPATTWTKHASIGPGTTADGTGDWAQREVIGLGTIEVERNKHSSEPFDVRSLSDDPIPGLTPPIARSTSQAPPAPPTTKRRRLPIWMAAALILLLATPLVFVTIHFTGFGTVSLQRETLPSKVDATHISPVEREDNGPEDKPAAIADDGANALETPQEQTPPPTATLPKRPQYKALSIPQSLNNIEVAHQKMTDFLSSKELLESVIKNSDGGEIDALDESLTRALERTTENDLRQVINAEGSISEQFRTTKSDLENYRKQLSEWGDENAVTGEIVAKEDTWASNQLKDFHHTEAQLLRLHEQHASLTAFKRKLTNAMTAIREAVPNESEYAIFMSVNRDGSYEFTGDDRFTLEDANAATQYQWLSRSASGEISDDEPRPKELSRPTGRPAKIIDVTPSPFRGLSISLIVPSGEVDTEAHDGIAVAMKFRYEVSEATTVPDDGKLRNKVVAACWRVVDSAKRIQRSASVIRQWPGNFGIENEGKGEANSQVIDEAKKQLGRFKPFSNRPLSKVTSQLLRDMQEAESLLGKCLKEIESSRKGGGNSGEHKSQSQILLESRQKEVRTLIGDVRDFLKVKDDFMGSESFVIGTVVFYEPSSEDQGSILRRRSTKLGEHTIAPILKLEVAEENK